MKLGLKCAQVTTAALSFQDLHASLPARILVRRREVTDDRCLTTESK